MEYSIIGTGNMAWFMAERLHAAGWKCAGIYGRNPVAAAELAAICRAPVYETLSAISDHDRHVCILAVSDDAIATVVSLLHFDYSLLVHTSGTVAIDVLETASAQAAVLWPASPVTRGRYPAQLPLLWEATEAGSAVIITAMAVVLGASPLVAANGTQRRQLHMSAVFVNNFVNHMLAIAEDLCTEQALSFELLKPLLQRTYERAMQEPAKGLQTGPARRGDITTMHTHEALLSGHPQWQQVYKSISASIKDMYQL